MGSTTAGGIAGAVDLAEVGTGLASGTTAAVNTAYVIPVPVDCSGYQYCDFDLVFSRTGDAVAAALVVVPYSYNTRLGAYFAGTAQTLAFGGTTAAYGALYQRIRVEVRGNPAVGLLVQSIAGTGASLNIDVTLS